MDARVVYWTAAWLNMVVMVGFAAAGVRAVRRGEVARHRRFMTVACALVAAFVASYLGKLALLGRESLELWQPSTVHVLRVHETFVFVMVAAGATAVYLALARRFPVSAQGLARRRGDLAASLRRHRRAGWTAVTCAALGALTALYVLLGMYARAG